MHIAATATSQVWPFTESKFAAQHCLAAFKGKALEASLRSASRQMPLYALLKSNVVRHTKEVLQLPAKTVQDVPGQQQQQQNISGE
jgi:hypothetical protein